MTKAVCLDEKYSTTRLLVKEKPIIENSPEDKFETVLFLPEGENRKGEGGLRIQGYFKKSYDDKPLVSIITVVFNGEKHLEQTIQSVINQRYENVEYIIIDGGSTDRTVDIIKKYEDQIDYWVSEKDEGIYDAMNKGISLSQGDIIGLINADDFYEENIFVSIIDVYQKNDADVIYGDIYFINGKQKKVSTANATGKRYGVFSYSFKWIWVDMLFPHPSSFVKRSTYKKYGTFDSSYKISGDYDIFLRFYIKKATFSYIPKVLASFREGGISMTDTQLKRQENFQIRKKHSLFIANLVSALSWFIQRIKSSKS
ncbi:glycosyltransferase family 2 protein [Sulfurovum sp. TSL1]|uniref:glycosyltransferase family 2 protein n=1 Tax=Sulfurovum sp. TSL1 TaxID=2826994 RepID=UPI001CC58271|nr:glycosyltransferase family 2 protein [Sulfurovum sp. TSL1]GIT99335.1 glycosyl transferase [Sulfurovum sp. TSL1]